MLLAVEAVIRAAGKRAAQADLRHRGGGTVFAILAVFTIGTGLTICSGFTISTGLAVLAVLTILPVKAVGTNGVTLRVKHQLAVQRPIPVAIGLLGQAYLRGVAVLAILPGLTVFSLVTLLSVIDDKFVEGLDVVVHLILPLLEGGEALFKVVHRVPQGRVVVVVLAGGERRARQEAGGEE